MRFLIKVTTHFPTRNAIAYYGRGGEHVSFSSRKRLCTDEERIYRLGFKTLDGAMNNYKYTHYNKEHQTVEIVPFYFG